MFLYEKIIYINILMFLEGFPIFKKFNLENYLLVHFS